MASLVINSLSNANIYLNGNNLLGRAAEFTVPQPKRVMQDYKGLGMVARLEVPAGWDKLEAEITWSSFDQTTIGLLMSSTGMQQFSALGDLQVLSAAGETSELPVIYNVTGLAKDPGAIPFKAQENISFKTAITVYHVDLSVGGIQVYLFDVFSNQFIVGGVDQLASFRANIGG
ncbi:MAG TPA: phage major tail tube protein [Acetobacteraceae bacterium]|nr:phage major tail tube protein [Acetobacteraceae bacterium]